MRRIFLFLLLNLFYAHNLYAYCNADMGGGQSCDAGQYYDSGTGNCKSCPNGYFCPGNDGKAYCCYINVSSNGLPYSENGATGPNQCYANVTCTENNQSHQCKVYGDNEGLACENSTVTSVFHEEWESGVPVCYSNTRACSLFGSETPGFMISDCTEIDSVEITGTATYSSAGKWNVMDCRYKIGIDDSVCRLRFVDGKHNNIDCMARAILDPAPITHGSANEFIVSVHDDIVYDKISKTQSLFSYGATHYYGYICYGCPSGYTVTEDDLQIVDGHQDEEVAKYDQCIWFVYNGNPVCNCSILPKGKYSGGCLWNDSIIQFYGWQDCDTSYCPVGQTTDGTGSTSASDCHYTADTQFCDAKGCFSLSDIENWTNPD